MTGPAQARKRTKGEGKEREQEKEDDEEEDDEEGEKEGQFEGICVSVRYVPCLFLFLI